MCSNDFWIIFAVPSVLRSHMKLLILFPLVTASIYCNQHNSIITWLHCFLPSSLIAMAASKWVQLLHADCRNTYTTQRQLTYLNLTRVSPLSIWPHWFPEPELVAALNCSSSRQVSMNISLVEWWLIFESTNRASWSLPFFTSHLGGNFSWLWLPIVNPTHWQWTQSL